MARILLAIVFTTFWITGEMSRNLAFAQSKSSQDNSANCAENPQAPVLQFPLLNLTPASRTCDPFPRYGLDEAQDIEFPETSEHPSGPLTPFWSQEAIGAPETAEFMAHFKNPHPDMPTKIGVIDEFFYKESLPSKITQYLKTCLKSPNCKYVKPGPVQMKGGMIVHFDHGTLVSQLIAGKFPVGVGQRVEISRTVPATYTWKQAGALMTELSQEGPPQVVNVSMNFSRSALDHKETIEALKAVQQKSILVLGAGNTFPMAISSLEGVQGIRVGSLTPEGMASEFSQEGTAVDISAPSDYDQQSRGRELTLKPLGGTSGATPLVTAAIGNAVNLLPGLSLDEAKTLLKKTAIRTTGTDDGRAMNGAGSLNEYLIARVAARLSVDWPKNRMRLADNDIYDFRDEATDAYSKAKALSQDSTNCSELTNRLRLLRTAFFLNPSSNEIRADLAHLYSAAGKSFQAKFYAKPGYVTDLNPLIKQSLRNRQLIAAISRGDVNEVKRILPKGMSGSDPLIRYRKIGLREAVRRIGDYGWVLSAEQLKVQTELDQALTTQD